MKSTLATTEGKLSEAQTLHTSLQAQVDDKTKAHQSASDKITVLEKALADLQSTHNSVSSDCAKYKEASQALQKQLDEKTAAHRGLEGVVAEKDLSLKSSADKVRLGLIALLTSANTGHRSRSWRKPSPKLEVSSQHWTPRSPTLRHVWLPKPAGSTTPRQSYRRSSTRRSRSLVAWRRSWKSFRLLRRRRFVRILLS